jgi:hypothetical protein
MAERDYLEQNIERLFRSVEPELKLPAPERQRILEKLAQESAGPDRAGAFASPQRIVLGKRVALAVAVVILIVVLLAVMLREGPKRPEEQIAGGVDVSRNVDDDGSKPEEEKTFADKTSVPDENLEAEMKSVLDMGVAGDVRGLMAILAEGHFLSKVVAANYLGRIGDENAIGPLEKAGADWVGDESENPFTLAIEQIRSRLGESDESKDDNEREVLLSDKDDPNIVEESDYAEKAPSQITSIEGFVYDESGNPRSGVTLYGEYLADYIVREGFPGGSVATVITDEKGFYRFEDLDEQLYLVHSDGGASLGVVRRAVLVVADKDRRLDFGAGRILSGWVRLDGQLLPNTRLLLADPYDPYITVFACYTVTDGQGNYAFSGAPTGLYGVYSESTEGADAWMKLGTVSFGSADVTNYNFDIEYTTVRADITGTDPNQMPDIVDVYVERKQAGNRLRVADAIWPAEAGQPYLIERLFAGSYDIVIDIPGGVSITEAIELSTEQAEQNIEITIPRLTSSVGGLLTGAYNEGLLVRSEDNKIRAAVEPDSGGVYFVEPLAAGRYFIEHRLTGEMAPLAGFGLEDDEDRVVDIDTDQWAQTQKVPVYVYAVDTSGVPIIGAGAGFEGSGLSDKEVTSRGAYFVVAPGPHVVRAEYSDGGYKQAGTNIELAAGNLTQPDSRAQVVYVTLEAK